MYTMASQHKNGILFKKKTELYTNYIPLKSNTISVT